MNIVDMSQIKNFWLVEMLPFTFEDRKNYKFVKEYQELSSENGIFGIGWSDYPELKEIFGKIPIEKSELTKEIYETIKENIKNCPKLQDLKLEDSYIENIYQNAWKELKKQEEKNNNTNKKNNEQPNDEQENNEQEDKGLNLAIKNFFSIEKGDIVLSRLRNGKYIVGIVEDNTKYYGSNEEDEEGKNEDDLIKKWKENEKIMSNGFGWRCKVKHWYPISREDVPSDIIGRCSQRNSYTITRLNDDRIKLFILKLLERQEKKKSNCPPIILNENNFASALNSDELEDLIYLYILDKKENEDLILLPSQCKISEPMYEFYLKHKKNMDGKIITCQVKNRSTVDFQKYKDEIEHDKKGMFEKIYLFSGIESYGNDKEKEKYKEKIEIIEKKELWKYLKDNKSYFNVLQDDYYYKFSSDEKEDEKVIISKAEENGWTLHKYQKAWKVKQNKQKKFKVSYYDNGELKSTSSKEYCNEILKSRIKAINFNYNAYDENKPNFYYNNDFRCFIINKKTNKEENEIKKVIEEVIPIIKKLVGD